MAHPTPLNPQTDSALWPFGETIEFILPLHAMDLSGKMDKGVPRPHAGTRDIVFSVDSNSKVHHNVLQPLGLGAVAGRPHIKLLSHQYLTAIVIIKSSPNALLPDTDLRTLALEQIHRHVPNHT